MINSLRWRERAEQHVAHGLQTARADLIECIRRGMPGRVVEIDDVNRRDAGFQERHVVVFHAQRFRDERGLFLLACRRPDRISEPGRRGFFAANLQLSVGNHVDQHHRLDGGQRAGPSRMGHVVSTAIGMVAELPFDEGFFAVEEDQFDAQRIGTCFQHAGQLEQNAGSIPSLAPTNRTPKSFVS